ncbi:MAG TPA: O-antigen ligase family protein [Thermoleophilaceae bacterium]
MSGPATGSSVARLILAAVVALGIGVFLVALYPSLALLLAALLIVALLALRRPAAAFLLAIGLIGFEGTIKIRLTIENVPHPLGVGAAALDLGLLAGLAGLLARAGLAPFREIWSRAGRAERAAFVLLALWLALSLVQIPLGGPFRTAVNGFRLTQAYFVIGVLGGVLLWRARPGAATVQAALIGLAVVGAYAAVRVVTGPSGAEQAFAVAPGAPQELGSAFRGVGSFSGTFGLTSFLVPSSVLAFAVAVALPRVRKLAILVCALGIVALLGSFVRAGLVAVTAGLLVVTAFLLIDRGVDRRLKLVVVGSLGVLFLATVVGVAASSGLSDQLRARAKGFISPGSDASAKIRRQTWKRTLREWRKEPLGAGLGTVGAATGVAGGTHGANAAGAAIRGRKEATYADNSFLKVLREQGIEGLALFLAGMLTLLAVLTAKLIRAGPIRHPVAAGALGAVCAYLVLFMFSEYIEQPGKVVVWTLLGVAVWDLRESRGND